VSSVDILPTVLTACGVAPPPALPGVNLLDPAAVAARESVCGECFTHTLVAADDPARSLLWRWIGRGRWKLIVPVAADRAAATVPPEGRLIDGESRARLERGEVELYDVAADPAEATNLAAAHPDIVRELRGAVDAWWNPFPPAVPAGPRGDH
jgi:uncharacterized sulfatase